MPTYPSGVYAPVTKTNGMTITPAMYNDPEAEIIAVENALLNGLPHALTVSTGGLTVSTGNTVLGQNVSVGGNSTLDGALQVTGASTFAGPVTFSTTVTFNGQILPTVPFCSLTNSTLIGVATGTETCLNWDTETADASGMHSTSVNSSRITFAASTGWYEVGASIPWSAAASSGGNFVRIRRNDTQGIAMSVSVAVTAAAQDNAVTALVRASDTSDFVTVTVFQGSGSTGSVSNVSTRTTLHFWARFVSK